MLNSCSTVDEFNTLLEKSTCISEYKWSSEKFNEAKNKLASGEGLGRGFLEHFLGKRKPLYTHIPAMPM